MAEFKYWLEKVPGNIYKAKCKLCNHEYTADISALKHHAKTEKHLEKEIPMKSTKLKMTQYMQQSDNFDMKLDAAVKSAEIKLVAFFAEHDVAFQGLDHWSDLLKDCFPDSKIAQKLAVKRTKGTAIVKNVIGKTEKSTLTKKLKETKFSILTDESTDISSMKTSCILVRYYDEEQGRVTSKFWDLIQVVEPGKITTATAEHLYKNILASLEDHGIPTENVIGFGSDGCNVMMGGKNSVASRLRQDFPQITIFKCICHSLHLCASEACKKLPRSAEGLARNIFNFFSSSAKRQSEFVEFQMFTDTAVHRMLHPSQTRWLSLTAVVDRVIEQWAALQLYFNEQWLDQKLIAAESIHNALNDPFMKLYFLFLKWVLPKFTRTNQYFQSSRVVITDLHDAMVELYTDLLKSYMKESYVHSTPLSEINPGDWSQFKLKTQMYLGVDVLSELQKTVVQARQDLLDYFHNKCHDFLLQACVEIKKRYDFQNPVLQKLKIFKPKHALTSVEREKTPSLVPILSLLPRVCSRENYQVVDDEWRPLASYPVDEEMKKMETDVFWGKLSVMKNDGDEYLFRNLAQCVLTILALSHSNCDSERVFSKVNRAKPKTRNRLNVDTMRGILLASQHVAVGTCANFRPSKEMLSRMTKDSLYDKKNPNLVMDNNLNINEEEEEESEITFE